MHLWRSRISDWIFLVGFFCLESRIETMNVSSMFWGVPNAKDKRESSIYPSPGGHPQDPGLPRPAATPAKPGLQTDLHVFLQATNPQSVPQCRATELTHTGA
jgi:hypothetical protein